MSHLPFWLLLLSLNTPLLWAYNWDQDFKEYCLEKHPDNTPCITQCKIGVNCSVMLTEFDNTLTLREKQYVLDIHNLMRERIARGDYIAANFPPATNMQVLNYDDDCEFMTTCWIRQCNFWHDVHYKPDGRRYGQNLHKRATSGSFKKVDDAFLDMPLRNWFVEIDLMKDHPQVFNGWYKVDGAGHFTALIWAKTTLMGCAKTLFKDPDGKENFFFFCNYFPNGNIKGAKIYSTEPFDCARNDRYPHLCGPVKNLIEEGVYHEEEHPDMGVGVTISCAIVEFPVYLVWQCVLSLVVMKLSTM